MGNIPVVNLADFTRGTPAERERFIRTYGDGLREFGFVTVDQHDVPIDLTHRVFEQAERFFTLAEETKRVFRARVVNPRWVAAMQRHGYKGAFELAATVDYLFGYDATAGVVDDWMYATLAQEYVFDERNRAFMQRSNPWALRGIAERLLEAAERGMWGRPDEAVLDRLRHTYLELEGDLEEGSA